MKIVNTHSCESSESSDFTASEKRSIACASTALALLAAPLIAYGISEAVNGDGAITKEIEYWVATEMVTLPIVGGIGCAAIEGAFNDRNNRRATLALLPSPTDINPRY